MADPTHPDHPDHRLYLGSRDAVHRLDASLGRAPDEHSDNMIASLPRLARENGLVRIDHVVLSGPAERLRPGGNAFVVQGRPDAPAPVRANGRAPGGGGVGRRVWGSGVGRYYHN